MDLIENRLEFPQCRPALGQLVRWLKAQVVMVLFWSAILLPVAYLSLLVTRLHSTEKLLLFLALIGLHSIALIAGHSHRSGADS